jgi:hypothetical protein
VRYRVNPLTRTAQWDSGRQIRGLGDRFVVAVVNADECFGDSIRNRAGGRWRALGCGTDRRRPPARTIAFDEAPA